MECVCGVVWWGWGWGEGEESRGPVHTTAQAAEAPALDAAAPVAGALQQAGSAQAGGRPPTSQLRKGMKLSRAMTVHRTLVAPSSALGWAKRRALRSLASPVRMGRAEKGSASIHAMPSPVCTLDCRSAGMW